MLVRKDPDTSHSAVTVPIFDMIFFRVEKRLPVVRWCTYLMSEVRSAV